MRASVVSWALALIGAGCLSQTRSPVAPRAAAPIDLTGYWVSLIVDEWRFRVDPQKGDLAYLPLNAAARQVANAWDPARDEAEGNACKAYGAIGVMQRPGRLHITWQDESSLRVEADAGSQTRIFRWGQASSKAVSPSLQGYSSAQWQLPGRAMLDLGGIGFVAGGGPDQRASPTGTLKVVTTRLLPGYLRKNGVPYSGNAVLTEYFNRLTGAEGETYLLLTAMLDDPEYLTQPFVRTYTFKLQSDGSGWDPTSCWVK